MSLPPQEALLAEGSLAGQVGDFDHAIACFRAALKQTPQHPGIMLYLSKAYGLSFRYREAEQWLQKALRLAPQDERALQLAAQNYQEWDHPDGALPFLRRAVASHAGSVDNWLHLGRALERSSQLVAAGEAALRAAELAPRHSEVLHLQARLAQRAGDFPEAERLLREALEQNPNPETAAELWYACASVCDAAGKFDLAWDAATKAKVLQSKLAESLREPADACRREIERLERPLPRFIAEEHASASGVNLAILCGYPRSGTTLMGQVLAGHPDLTYADEVLALARVLRQGENLTEPARADWFFHTGPQQRDALRREYQRCVEAQLERQVKWQRPVVLDKNPAVTRCVPAMLSLFPNLKVLFPVRDPRDVAISCYLRPFPVNAFTAHFNRLNTLATHLRANYAVWKAMCTRLPLAHLEVRYEDMVASPIQTNRMVCEFLCLDPSALPSDHRPSATRRFIHSPTYAEVLQPLHARAVGRWQAYSAHLRPELDSLHELAREQGYL